MVTVTLSGIRAGDSTRISDTLALDADGLATLGKYDENCERLSAAAIFKTGFPALESLSMSAAAGVVVRVSAYRDADVSEFLHLARPLFLQDERASFASAMAVYGRGTSSGPIREQLGFIRRLYDRGDYAPYMNFTTAGMAVFSDKMTRVWLNAREYHQDEDKEHAVRGVESMLTPEAARGLFIAQLSGRVKAIDKLHDMVVRTLAAVAARNEDT